MKSIIRIELGKPQSLRHVCPTSGRPATFHMEFVGRYRQVCAAASLWLNSLWDTAKRDSSGPGAWTGSHRVQLTLRVSSPGEDDYEAIIVGQLSCSAVVLLSRNLGRIELEVQRRHRLEASWDLWELIPYSFVDVNDWLVPKQHESGT